MSKTPTVEEQLELLKRLNLQFAGMVMDLCAAVAAIGRIQADPATMTPEVRKKLMLLADSLEKYSKDSWEKIMESDQRQRSGGGSK